MKTGIKIYGVLVGVVATVGLVFGIVAHTQQAPVDSEYKVKFGASGNMMAEDYIPYVMYNDGYNSTNDIKTSANLYAATTTLTGTLTGVAANFTGALTGTSLTLNGQLNNLESYESMVAGINTSTVSESGKTYYITVSSTHILPPVTTATGTVYRFVIASSVDNNVTVGTYDGGDVIEGALIVAGAVVDCDAEDTLTFVGDGENLGDYVELRSNGAKWFIGSSGALTTGKLTCTAS